MGKAIENLINMKRLYILIFLSFLSIVTFSQRNCPSVIDLAQMQIQDPDRYQRFIDLENFTANYVANQNNPNQRLINPNGIITIPVVVHVLHRGEAEGTGRNISLAQIQSQIDVLNEDFRRLNADRVNTPAAFAGVAADYGFEFRLACQDPNGNTTNGVVRRQTNKNSFTFILNANNTTNENAMGIKMTNISGDDPWPTNSYLNIWVCDFSDGTLGYATFPADYAVNPSVDGVVIHYTAFGRTGNVVSPFHLGRTATHEIGHWLNLHHIWGDAVCGDDFVGDTPQQHNQNFGCPGFPHPSNCPGNGANGDMFMNYMDYTDDGCMNIYTNGQQLRGKAIFATGGPRAVFINNYFKIQQPTSSISCVGNINLTNPNCLSATWTITSGPATITSGQGTNSVQVQGSGTGIVHIVATAGNYTDEIDFNISNTAPSTPTLTAVKTSGPGEPTSYHFTATAISGATYTWYVSGMATNPQQSGTSNEFDWYFPCRVTKSVYCIVNTACGSATSNSVSETGECTRAGAFTLSPNPATSTVTVSSANTNTTETTNSSIDEIRIYDLSGNMKKYQKFNKVKSATINITGLTKGTYFVEITNGTYREKQQLIIQK